MLADNLEIRTARKTADLEKRISDLERLVSWLIGLLIDLVAVGLGIAGALFVAGDREKKIERQGHGFLIRGPTVQDVEIRNAFV